MNDQTFQLYSFHEIAVIDSFCLDIQYFQYIPQQLISKIIPKIIIVVTKIVGYTDASSIVDDVSNYETNGVMVGWVDGRDGWAVGIIVGSMVGLYVGLLMVGIDVGDWDGVSVGVVVGNAEGDDVGIAVIGLVVGNEEDDDVGFVVIGLEVGECDGKCVTVAVANCTWISL